MKFVSDKVSRQKLRLIQNCSLIIGKNKLAIGTAKDEKWLFKKKMSIHTFTYSKNTDNRLCAQS